VATSLAGLPWRRIAIAPAPNEAALLETMERSLVTEKSA